MKIFKHCHQWLKLIRAFALVLMLTAFAKSQVLAWSCPYHNSGGGDPDVLNYWFTSKLKRPSEMDAFISQCGGRLNYKNLDTSIEYGQYRTFWDYRTLDSGGCTHKEWWFYMKKTACDGTMQHCRTGYISAADSFAKKCSWACERYTALTGNSCSTVAYQDTVGIFDEKGETFEDKPLKWATPAKEALNRMRRAVSDVNELVKKNFDDLENSEVPDPTGNNSAAVESKLNYIESNAGRTVTDSQINSLQSLADSKKYYYDKYTTLYDHRDSYEYRYRYIVSYNDYSASCSTNQSYSDCGKDLKNYRDSYLNKYHNSTDSSDRDWYYKQYLRYYYLYYYGSYKQEWWYYFHYGSYSWSCSDYTSVSTCQNTLWTRKNDYYNEWNEAKNNVEASKQYQEKMPNLKEELKEAIEIARAALSYYEQVKGRNQEGAWASDLCPNRNSESERCTIRKLMEGCFRAVNNRLITGGTSEYATNGQIYGGQESRNSFCNNPHSNLAYLNTGSCEKFGCYRYEKDCREKNPFYVEVGESCDVGYSLGNVWVPELGRYCKKCGGYSNCAEAAAYGWYYDSIGQKWVQMWGGEEEMSGDRYWAIRTERCPYGDAGSIFKKLPTTGQSCLVACRKPCNQVRNNAGQFMREVGTCGSGQVGVPVEVTYRGLKYQCISHCENACKHNNMYTTQEVFKSYGQGGNCQSGTSLATDGAPISSHRRQVYSDSSTVTCYNDLCPAAPTPPPYPDDGKCEAYGYYGFDNIAAQCETGESEVCPGGETVYTSEGEKITCSCGCKTIGTPDLQCYGKNTDSNKAGDLYENRTEKFYRERNAWLTWRGERTSGKVIYAPKAYYRAGATTEDIQICRWQKCSPNDAEAFAERNDLKSCGENEQAEYGYREDGCGQVYGFVRRCVSNPSGNACSPSSGSYFTSTGYGYYGRYYRGNGCTCGPQREWICTGKDDDNCREEIVGCIHCPPACVNECGNPKNSDEKEQNYCAYGFYKVDCRGPNGETKNDDSCGVETYGTKACHQPSCVNPDLIFSDASRTNYLKCHTAVDLDTTHHDKKTYPVNGRTITPGYGVGGYYDCIYGNVAVSDEDSFHSECRDTVNEFNASHSKECFRILHCGEMSDGRGGYKADPGHAQEFNKMAYLGVVPAGKDGETNSIFIPGTESTNYRVGINGKRCGRYLKVSQPQWTIANYDSKANGSLSSAGTDDNMSDGRCGGGSSSIAKLNNTDFTDAAKNNFSYKYFADKVEIDKLPDCQAVVKRISERNYSDKDADGFYICKITGTDKPYDEKVREDSWGLEKRVSTSLLGGKNDQTMIQNASFFDPNTNFVIFVTEKNFFIDTNIYTASGHFKAIIAKDTIYIDPGVGTLPSVAINDNGGCRSPYTADLQGFFAAKEFKIAQWRVADPDLLPFNGDLYCDRQLAVAGTMLQWSKDENGADLTNELKLPRTFGACVGGKETKADWEAIEKNPLSYPNYNGRMSPHLFYSRTDFNTSAPSWMKDPHVQRYEVAI